MPSVEAEQRRGKRCMYCAHKFEQHEDKFHSLRTNGENRRFDHNYGDKQGRIRAGVDKFYYSRPPYACQNCVNRSGGNPDLL
tara:strand:+ start:1354 stop:1599 length:246 start_codon:yes stop_codon:yes gene_type:complete